MKTNSTIFRHHEKPLSRQAPRIDYFVIIVYGVIMKPAIARKRKIGGLSLIILIISNYLYNRPYFKNRSGAGK